MADTSPQNLSNHTRYDPVFHFFILPVFSLLLLASIVHLFIRPDLHSVVLVVVAIAMSAVIFKVHLYPLKIHRRLIRLEERLRLATLIDPALRPRIAEFTESQLIALRFASDAELPALAARALNEKLAAPKSRKRSSNGAPTTGECESRGFA